jgi:hypothetical protein
VFTLVLADLGKFKTIYSLLSVGLRSVGFLERWIGLAGRDGGGLEENVHGTKYITFRQFVKDKYMALIVKTATITVSPKAWVKFAVLAHSKGLSVSAMLRQMVAQALRHDARDRALTLRAAQGE